MPESPPVALTIAGSDCSAGAGVQADLKTFSAFGCYGLTALTSVVAEVPAKVARIQNLDAEIIMAQIEALAGVFPIRAMKTGMLGGRAQIEAVLRGLEHRGLREVPLVVDPVMIATSGRRLLEEDAMDVLITRLFPRATVITPNLDEAAVLAGNRPTTREDMEQCGRVLAARYECAVLVKGGHLSGHAEDVLVEQDEATWFGGKRISGVHTHGTGCTLSAAITAGLSQGLALREAIARAKQFVAGAIAGHFRWNSSGEKVDALNHRSRSGQEALQPGPSMLTSGLTL